jgi:hypothetical protein
MQQDQLEDLVGKIRAFEGSLTEDEQSMFDADALNGIAGLSEEDLQKFLEEKAGISPDEEAQGSVMAAAASIAYHC